MSKKYILPETDDPKLASEPVAAYSIPQEQSMKDYQISKDFVARDASSLAKKICFSDEAFEYHRKHGFYMSEMPEQESVLSEEELIEQLDAADDEGYVTDEEVNHLMNLWQLAV